MQAAAASLPQQGWPVPPAHCMQQAVAQVSAAGSRPNFGFSELVRCVPAVTAGVVSMPWHTTHLGCNRRVTCALCAGRCAAARRWCTLCARGCGRTARPQLQRLTQSGKGPCEQPASLDARARRRARRQQSSVTPGTQHARGITWVHCKLVCGATTHHGLTAASLAVQRRKCNATLLSPPHQHTKQQPTTYIQALSLARTSPAAPGKHTTPHRRHGAATHNASPLLLPRHAAGSSRPTREHQLALLPSNRM
jgi:hypothetical protein